MSPADPLLQLINLSTKRVSNKRLPSCEVWQQISAGPVILFANFAGAGYSGSHQSLILFLPTTLYLYVLKVEMEACAHPPKILVLVL